MANPPAGRISRLLDAPNEEGLGMPLLKEHATEALPLRYSLPFQYGLQLGCAMFSLLLSVFFVVSSLVVNVEKKEAAAWRFSSSATSGLAALLALAAVAGVVFTINYLLTPHVLYQAFAFVPYRVLYLVVSLTRPNGASPFSLSNIGLTISLILVSFVSVCSSIYYFRLVRFHRVFRTFQTDHSLRMVVSAECLVDLMKECGQHPTVSQVAELLTCLEPDSPTNTNLTYNDFCVIQARFSSILSRRAKARKKAVQQHLINNAKEGERMLERAFEET